MVDTSTCLLSIGCHGLGVRSHDQVLLRIRCSGLEGASFRRGRHQLQPGCHFRGVPVRAAATTWVIALLETAASAWLSSSDWCLAPATTRWMLLSDSAARSICGVSQLVWVSTGAVSTYSGRLPRSVTVPAWAIIVGTMATSSRSLRACPAVDRSARTWSLVRAGSSALPKPLTSWLTPRRARPGYNPVTVVAVSLKDG